MNWLILLLGLLLIGAGSLLTFVAGRRITQSDAKPTEEKIQQVLDEIKDVRNTIPASDKSEALDKIEDDFTTWARNFSEQREGKSVELQDAQLKLKSKLLADSRVIRPVYEHVISVLRKSITEYNRLSGGNVVAVLPPLPEQISRTDTNPWEGSVVFNDSTSWSLMIGTVDDASSTPALRFWFTEKPGRLQTLEGFSVWVDVESKLVTTRLSGARFPTAAGWANRLSLDNYADKLRTVVQQLLEAQLLTLEQSSQQQPPPPS